VFDIKESRTLLYSRTNKYTQSQKEVDKTNIVTFCT